MTGALILIGVVRWSENAKQNLTLLGKGYSASAGYAGGVFLKVSCFVRASRVVTMFVLFIVGAVARQFITSQHPIPITIHTMKHGDQAAIKFMLFNYPIFVAIQLGKAAILACGKLVKAYRAIIICVEFLGAHHRFILAISRYIGASKAGNECC